MADEIPENFDLEDCYDAENQTVQLEGEFGFDELEQILIWLYERNING